MQSSCWPVTDRRSSGVTVGLFVSSRQQQQNPLLITSVRLMERRLVNGRRASGKNLIADGDLGTAGELPRFISRSRREAQDVGRPLRH